MENVICTHGFQPPSQFGYSPGLGIYADVRRISSGNMRSASPPVGSLSAGNTSPPHILHSAEAVTIPAKPASKLSFVVYLKGWVSYLGTDSSLLLDLSHSSCTRIWGRLRTLDCNALSIGVGIMRIIGAVGEISQTKLKRQ